MLVLVVGLVLILAASIVKVVRVARALDAPAARFGAVMTWLVGTLAISVLPAFAALAILDELTSVVRFPDGGIDRLAAATMWIGICDLAGVGRLVSPPEEERGKPADLTRDRRGLFAAAMLLTAVYTAALLITVGFIDDAHVGIGVAIALGFVAAAATVQGRPNGPGMGPLTRRPGDAPTATAGPAPDVAPPIPPDEPLDPEPEDGDERPTAGRER